MNLIDKKWRPLVIHSLLIFNLRAPINFLGAIIKAAYLHVIPPNINKNINWRIDFFHLY